MPLGEIPSTGIAPAESVIEGGAVVLGIGAVILVVAAGVYMIVNQKNPITRR